MEANFSSYYTTNENIAEYFNIIEIENDNRRFEVSFIYDSKEDSFIISSKILNSSKEIIFENKILFEYFSMNYGHEFIRAFKSYLYNVNRDELIEVPMPETKFIYKDFYFYNDYQYGYIVGKINKNNDFIILNMMEDEVEEFEYETKFDKLFTFLDEILDGRINDTKYIECNTDEIKNKFIIDDNQEVLIILDEINNTKNIRYNYNEDKITELNLIETSSFTFKNSSLINIDSINNIEYEENTNEFSKLVITRKDKTKFIISSKNYNTLKDICELIKSMI